MTAPTEQVEVAAPVSIAAIAKPRLPDITSVLVEMAPPTMTSKCFERECGHVFGDHFITFSDKRSGCALVKTGPQGGNPRLCPCRGFVLMPPQPFIRG